MRSLFLQTFTAPSQPQRTSRPLHSNFTAPATSHELRCHFTRTSHELHKLHIALHNHRKSVTKLEQVDVAPRGGGTSGRAAQRERVSETTSLAQPASARARRICSASVAASGAARVSGLLNKHVKLSARIWIREATRQISRLVSRTVRLLGLRPSSLAHSTSLTPHAHLRCASQGLRFKV